jgi:hypothetical protein
MLTTHLRRCLKTKTHVISLTELSTMLIEPICFCFEAGGLYDETLNMTFKSVSFCDIILGKVAIPFMQVKDFLSEII